MARGERGEGVFGRVGEGEKTESFLKKMD